VNRVHDERALNRGERAEARVASLELLHHEAVRDVVHPGAAVAGEVGAEQAELRDLGHEFHRKGAIEPDVLLDPRHELLGDELAHGVARHPFFVGERLVEPQEVDAVLSFRGAPELRRGVEG